MRRCALFLSFAFVAAACGGGGGGGSTPTPSSPTPPTPTTWTLSGRVTETPPTQTIPIAGATVRVTDGPNANRSATTDSGGNYTLSNLQQSGFTVSVTADGYQPRSQGVDLTQNRTLNFELAPSGPRRTFGPGQYRVGTDIAAGRYFNDPASGCYWERLSGFGGTLSDVLANEFVGFNAAQWIVDILPSDRGFQTDGECGTWFNTPRHGQQNSITPGVWLVGQQIAPGTYRANVREGCYWERLRNFEGTLSAVIANDFVSTSGSRIIEIRSGDVGFSADDDCGEWTRALAPQVSAPNEGTTSPADIERNRQANRQQSRSPHPLR